MTVRTYPKLSLVTAYRARRAHLDLLLSRLADIREGEGFTDFELILVEGDAQPTVADLGERYEWLRYLYVPLPGPFNRALLTNRGAAVSKGEYLMAYDVDLLPAEGVLANHLALATASPVCLVAGYRLQLPEMLSAPVVLPSADQLIEGSGVLRKPLVCPEDSYGSLVKYLLCQEKGGVCTCYPAKAFSAVGGLDEDFVGWGPEEQDLMERICDTDLALVRSYDLLYYHLPHDREEEWYDAVLIAANRERLDERRRASKGKGV
jgi:GT2 family glycosyltransferase